MWEKALTPKSCRYYAIARYSGTEKTWTAYFKAFKSIEALADAVNRERTAKIGRRGLLALANDAALAFPKKAVTRMCAALADRDKLSEMKTLLEWLGLLWSGTVPEADFSRIPYAIGLADWLMDRDS